MQAPAPRRHGGRCGATVIFELYKNHDAVRREGRPRATRLSDRRRAPTMTHAQQRRRARANRWPMTPSPHAHHRQDGCAGVSARRRVGITWAKASLRRGSRTHRAWRARLRGFNFFDNCWEYHNGKSEIWLGPRAPPGKRDKGLPHDQGVHARPRRGSSPWRCSSSHWRRPAHRSLGPCGKCTAWASTKRSGTRPSRKAGVVEGPGQGPSSRARCASSASRATKIRAVHLKMLSYNYAWDTVQMPLKLLRCELSQLRANKCCRSS